MGSAPLKHVHRTDKHPAKTTQRELEDIVFMEANAKWEYHPHSDTLVIIVQVANNNDHRMLMDNGSAVDIFYLEAYKMIGLT